MQSLSSFSFQSWLNGLQSSSQLYSRIHILDALAFKTLFFFSRNINLHITLKWGGRCQFVEPFFTSYHLLNALWSYFFPSHPISMNPGFFILSPSLLFPFFLLHFGFLLLFSRSLRSCVNFATLTLITSNRIFFIKTTVLINFLFTITHTLDRSIKLTPEFTQLMILYVWF